MVFLISYSLEVASQKPPKVCHFSQTNVDSSFCLLSFNYSFPFPLLLPNMVPSINYEKLRDLEEGETLLSDHPLQSGIARRSILTSSTLKIILLLSLLCNALVLPQIVYFWGKHDNTCEAPLTEYGMLASTNSA